MAIGTGFFGILVVSISVHAGIFGNKKEALREALQKQDWSASLSYTQELLESSASDTQSDLLRLVQALAFHRQGNVKESIKSLEPIKLQSLYFSWSRIFLMRLAYVSNNRTLLSESLHQLGNLPLKGELKLERRFYEAHLFLENQQWIQAVKILRSIEKSSRGTELQTPVLEALALGESNIDKATTVCKTILNVYSRVPLHPWFKEVAPEIKAIPLGDKKVSCAVTTKDFEKRKRMLNLMGESLRASEEMKHWFKLTNLSIRQQKKMEAQQLLSEGHPELAIQSLKMVLINEGDTEVLTPLSYAAARAGDMKLAIQSALQVYKASGPSKKGTMALYQAAVWAYQIRDYENAEKRFSQVRVIRLSAAYRKEILWYQGWLKYLKQDYAAAEKGFRSFQKIKKGKLKVESPERLQYWLAMSLNKQKKFEKAKVLFQKLAQKKGMTYYSFLARSRLKQIPDRAISSEEPNKAIQLSVISRSMYSTPFGEEAPWPSPQESEQTEEILESNDSDETTLLAEEEKSEDNPEDNSDDEKNVQTDAGSSTEDGPLDLFSKAEGNEKLERARAFWSFGLEDLARREIAELEKYSRNFELFKRLIDEYRQMTLYNKISVLGQSFVSKANMQSRRFIYEAIYPQAYLEEVQKASKELSVAPALVWGIMKAESMYRPWVKSPVGAVGLMQVMPTTGQKIAELLNYQGFTPQVLLRPQEAIRFGTKYLDRLSKKFDRSVPLVAAAYNAGPHRVSQWLYYFGYMQLDEWIEHIPYLETRNYVKKVTVNYMAYHELYGKSMGEALAYSEPVPVQITGVPETKENWE